VTARALIKEADIVRAIRAAKKLGMSVSIAKDGTIMFDAERPGRNDQLLTPLPDEPIRILKRPKRKVF
jgi:hypothetical protein